MDVIIHANLVCGHWKCCVSRPGAVAHQAQQNFLATHRTLMPAETLPGKLISRFSIRQHFSATLERAIQQPIWHRSSLDQHNAPQLELPEPQPGTGCTGVHTARLRYPA